MDPYGIEPKKRNQVRHTPPSRSNFLNRFRDRIVKCDDDWIIVRNWASELSMPILIVASLFNSLVAEGILEGPLPVPVEEEHLKYGGRGICFLNGKWYYRDFEFERFYKWGSRGCQKVKKCGKSELPIGRQPSKRTISKKAQERPLKLCEWNGKGYRINRDAPTFKEAARTQVQVTTGSICNRCGIQLDFNGKHSRRSRGHTRIKCNKFIVKTVMES